MLKERRRSNLAPRKGALLMDLTTMMAFVGYSVTVFMAGYMFGKDSRKKKKAATDSNQ